VTAAGGRRLVACYGGTFDPVHLGHIGAALDVCVLGGCDALHLLPASVPPHRTVPGADAGQRLRMLELAVADACTAKGGTRLVVDARELRRAGPSYTVDTLASLRGELGEDIALGWVLGTDALAELAGWHRWRELVSLAHLLVLERPGHPLPTEGEVGALVEERRVADCGRHREAPGGRLWCVGQRPVAISATAVRTRLEALARAGTTDGLDSACDGLLSPSVWAYIREQGLYGVPRVRQ
jgi:nicotinate-nucleotide adenylyltransferase